LAILAREHMMRYTDWVVMMKQTKFWARMRRFITDWVELMR